MTRTKVIIAGGGVAGPVLAILLKFRGHDTIIYEHLDASTDTVLSLVLRANELKVLSVIPGRLDKVAKHEVFEIVQYSALAEAQRELTRYGVNGVCRPVLLRALIEEAHWQGRDVPVAFGHQLVRIEQHEESVTVRFANEHEISWA